MTYVRDEHVAWAVVDRMRSMLLEAPHPAFNVTQAYAIFSSILCWVVQHVRIRDDQVECGTDRSAQGLWKRLNEEAIGAPPWFIFTESVDRIVVVGAESVRVPEPSGFDEHTADRFLINLRDAVAHADARNVEPFNVPSGPEQVLAGFTFQCSERGQNRRIVWRGHITLLEEDLRRIGIELATRYCDALDASGVSRGDRVLPSDAASSIREVAA